MKIRIYNTDNDAFGQTNESRAEEIARILERAAEKIRQGLFYGVLLDSNGNTVGEFTL